MSRAKSRNIDVCADCGAPDPSWTALNRGILLCIQCCSVHRGLGRRISQIKSLQKSSLSSTQISMLQSLHNSGVNNIWEHTLLENGSKLNKRKPSPKDSLEVKTEFIKAKHERLEFAFRPHNEDGLLCVENELGKQLHASVRTGNLETSFRLLIQGADPNYFHDEKGTTPLHVAAKAHQKEQVELLLTHGADPTCPDVTGQTPVDFAKQHAKKDLYNRLVESMYEVTDQFSYFLNFRKPDHVNGVHLIIPQVNLNNNSTSHVKKLEKLPNHVFEELVMDVYDEVDRRITESIWTSSGDTLQFNGVPFLPVDQELSTTRNQSRQKLGRFTTPELKSLIQDILIDIERRQQLSDKYQSKLSRSSIISDDDPLYDSVASDDDYATTDVKVEKEETTVDAPTVPDENQNPTKMPIVESSHDSKIVQMLTKQLLESHETILDLKLEINSLKSLVEQLSSENFELKSKLNQITKDGNQRSESQPVESSQKDQKPSNGPLPSADLELRSNKKRPSSMYETREGLKTQNWQTLKHMYQKNENARNTIQGCPQAVQSKEIIAFTEHVTKCIQELWSVIQGAGRENCVPYAGKIRNAVNNLTQALPSFDVSISYMEKTAAALKEFWYIVQGDGKRYAIDFSSKVKLAVNNMVYCMPPENNGEIVRHIEECVHYLHVNCMGLQTAYKSSDEEQTEMYMQKVRKCAYEIAKDTKQLVTKYTSQ